MPTYLLIILDRAGTIVDRANSPGQLDFSKVGKHTQYAVGITWGGSIWIVATVDLAGYETQADWVNHQLCEDIDFRRAFSGFEDEVKNANGPLIAFGAP